MLYSPWSLMLYSCMVQLGTALHDIHHAAHFMQDRVGVTGEATTSPKYLKGLGM